MSPVHQHHAREWENERENGEAVSRLLLPCRFLIMVDQPALIHAFPVFREKMPVRALFYGCVVLLAADEALHQAGLLIDKFCRMVFFCHSPVVSPGRHIEVWFGVPANARAKRR